MTFVCRAIGERITAATEMSLSNGTWVQASAVSRNRLSPTRWNTSQGEEPRTTSYLSFYMFLTAQQAPESCTSMYFDPLLIAQSGDGLVSSDPNAKRVTLDELEPQTEREPQAPVPTDENDATNAITTSTTDTRDESSAPVDSRACCCLVALLAAFAVIETTRASAE
mmetsp:Transcript_33889/g.102389  ORF Transcript_33889/g.102389 Transcript_33889/m.102389 type:complete len:167 (-) Transcript_33889:208-708(-)